MNNTVETMPNTPVYQSLGDGLVLRQATLADRAGLIAFNSTMHNVISGAEVEYLIDGRDGRFKVEDFLVVVDQTGRIVSTLCLMETEWRLGQTTIRFGQPEYVGTLEEYRGRGLVRRQFEILHRWMDERGLAFGLIGGIDYYYRQFGYDYAVEIERLGRLTVAQHAGKLTVPEGIEVRLLTEADIPLVERMNYERDHQFDMSTILPPYAWQWAVEVQGFDRNEMENWVAVREGQIIGSARVGGKPANLYITHFTGDETVAQSLLATALARPGAEKLRVLGNTDTPVANLLTRLEPEPLRNEALYVRINNPVAALQTLAGELERRLVASPFAGLSRDLELGCYRFGLGLVFEEGRLVKVEKRPGGQDPKIGIPPELLPRLFFGYRDLDELADLYPDLNATASEDWNLLKVLFPRLKGYTRFSL